MRSAIEPGITLRRMAPALACCLVLILSGTAFAFMEMSTSGGPAMRTTHMLWQETPHAKPCTFDPTTGGWKIPGIGRVHVKRLFCLPRPPAEEKEAGRVSPVLAVKSDLQCAPQGE